MKDMKHSHYSTHLLLLLSVIAGILSSSFLNAANEYKVEAVKQAAINIDLELNFAADPIEYSPFTNNLFTLTLTNNGEEDATGIAVYAPFPNSSLSYTGSTVSQGDYSVWTSIWEVGDLASGETAVLELSLFVLNVENDISLFAQVQAANEEDIDSTPDNNITQIPEEDDEAIVTITHLGGGGGGGGNENVDIELTMDTNHAEVNVGSQFSYTLKATNSGEDNATGLRVHFLLPDEVKYISNNNDQTTYDPITGEWNIGNLPSKATRSVLIDVEVLVGGIISASAEVVTMNETDVDSTPNNGDESEDDFYSIDMLGLQIDLELDMELQEGASNIVVQGEEVTFLVHVENKGPTVGYNSKIRAILPGGFTYLNNTVTMGEYVDDLGVWVIGDIPPFETQTMEITVTMDIEGPLTYTCEARTSNVPDIDSTPSNFDPNEDDIDSLTIYTAAVLSDIELNASVKDSLEKSEEVRFLTVTVTNNGPANATDIIVKDVFPSELDLITANTENGTYEERIWTIGDLENEETAVLNLEVNVELLMDSVTYFAHVITASPFDSDSTPDNNDTQIPHEDDEASVIISPVIIDTDIESNFEVGKFSLYPTPTLGLVNLSYTSKSKQIKLTLSDLSGHNLYHETLKLTSPQNTIQLDLTKFPTGVYFLNALTENGHFSAKILKE